MKLRTCTSVLFTSLLLSAAAMPASSADARSDVADASTSTSTSAPSDKAFTTVETVPVHEELCVAMREVDPGNTCEEQVTTTTSTSSTDPHTTSADPGNSTDQVRYRSFTQKRKNASGPEMWSFTQHGTFRYNVVTRSVAKTYQSCSDTSGIGFGVDVTECQAYGVSGHVRFMNRARISFIAKGVPLHATFSQWANAYYTGGLYYHTTQT